MKTIRDNSALLNGPDIDVWDRVKTLAPQSTPVRVGLFRRSESSTAYSKPTSSAVVRTGSVAQDSTAARSYPWERFPVATAQATTGLSRASRASQWKRPDGDAQTFDLLRTRLLQVLGKNDLISVAVTAPTPGCGTTFTATNLALSCARLPACRTLLIDLNFRSPGVADALKLLPTGSLRQGLLGSVPLTSCLARFGANLLVGLADKTQPDPAELLMDPRTTATLTRLKEALQPTIIIFDMPPMLAYDDATALLPNVDGVLLVTDGTRTVASQIKQCQDILVDQTQLLGVVLNKSRPCGAEGLRYSDA